MCQEEEDEDEEYDDLDDAFTRLVMFDFNHFFFIELELKRIKMLNIDVQVQSIAYVPVSICEPAQYSTYLHIQYKQDRFW